jgi:predicted ferric reductase
MIILIFASFLAVGSFLAHSNALCRKLTHYDIQRRICDGLSVGELYCATVIATSCVLFAYNSIDDLSVMFGKLATNILCLSLLPMSKTAYAVAFNVSPDRAVKYHTILSLVFMWTVGVHVVLEIYDEETGLFDFETLLDDEHRLRAVPLYGTASTLLCVFTTTATLLKRFEWNMFLVAHISASCGVFLFASLHSFNYYQSVLITLAVYGADYIYRLFFLKTAIAKVRSENHAVRIDFPTIMAYKPGQFVYICVPSLHGRNAVAFHPFSMASSPHESTMSFIVKCQDVSADKLDVWTTQLERMCASHQNHHQTEIPIIVSKPYGSLTINMNQTRHLFMIAGGFGVVPWISIMKYLIEIDRAAIQQSATSDFANLKSAYLMWISSKRFRILDNEVADLVDEIIIWQRIKLTVLVFEYRVSASSIFKAIVDKDADIKSVHKSVLVCGPRSLIQDVESESRKREIDCHSENF